MNTLTKIQNELVSQKTKRNEFGKFNYRTAEDICAALKPLLDKYEASVWFEDDVVAIADRPYLKTTLTYRHNDTTIKVPAFAAIDYNHKGMSAEQCCGACMSYVHKYALGSLLLIDNEADPDSLPQQTPIQKSNSKEMRYAEACERVKACDTAEEVKEVFMEYPEYKQDAAFKRVCRMRTDEINGVA